MPDWHEKIKNMEGWSFGGGGAMADELAAQTATGRNSANCFLWREGVRMPKVGEQSYIKNSKGNAVCVIEVLRVEKFAFLEVPPEFARAEGYSDIDEWRVVHREFFSSVHALFQDQSPIVCQWFKVVHIF